MSELRDIQLSLPMQLLQAREAAMAHFRPMLRRHGLTEQQWRVIRVLASEPALDARELAERSLLLAPSLSRILAHLEASGLVVRKAHAADQRRSLLALTPRGKRSFVPLGQTQRRCTTTSRPGLGGKAGDAVRAGLPNLMKPLSWRRRRNNHADP